MKRNKKNNSIKSSPISAELEYRRDKAVLPHKCPRCGNRVGELHAVNERTGFKSFYCLSCTIKVMDGKG